MKVPANRIAFDSQDRAAILSIIDGCLSSGQISAGAQAGMFESEFAGYVGARHAVAMSSGTSALESTMRLLEVERKEVLLQANAFYSCALAPIRSGATVKLVDIQRDSLTPSCDQFEAGLSARTAGIIIVHMGGIVAPEIERVRDLCTRAGVWLLEDCSHAHGSWLQGKHAGTFGVAGVFSLYATKVMTSAEGGMLITDDAVLAEQARIDRDLGKPDPWRSLHVRLGSNSRMSDIHAAIGRVQLRRLEELVKLRRLVADRYTELLQQVDSVHIIQPGHQSSSSWYKYVVVLDPNVDRQVIRSSLADDGIALGGEIYEIPLHQQPAYAGHFSSERFPVAEEICANHICLPIYPDMQKWETECVVDSLRRALENSKADGRSVR